MHIQRSRQDNIKTARPYVKMWQKLEKELKHAMIQLKSDLHKNKSVKTIQKDKNELVLLLGECNYLTRECLHWSRTQKRKKR